MQDRRASARQARVAAHHRRRAPAPPPTAPAAPAISCANTSDADSLAEGSTGNYFMLCISHNLTGVGAARGDRCPHSPRISAEGSSYPPSAKHTLWRGRFCAQHLAAPEASNRQYKDLRRNRRNEACFADGRVCGASKQGEQVPLPRTNLPRSPPRHSPSPRQSSGGAGRAGSGQQLSLGLQPFLVPAPQPRPAPHPPRLPWMA